MDIQSCIFQLSDQIDDIQSIIPENNYIQIMDLLKSIHDKTKLISQPNTINMIEIDFPNEEECDCSECQEAREDEEEEDNDEDSSENNDL